jgi:hypothetical protein
MHQSLIEISITWIKTMTHAGKIYGIQTPAGFDSYWCLRISHQKKKHVTNSYYIIHTNKHSLWIQLPSGDPTVRYGKSPCLIGKSTIAMAMFNSKLYDLKPFSSAGSNIIQHPTIVGPRKVFGGSEDFHKKKCPFWGWFYMYPTRTRILSIYI